MKCDTCTHCVGRGLAKKTCIVLSDDLMEFVCTESSAEVCEYYTKKEPMRRETIVEYLRRKIWEGTS